MGAAWSLGSQERVARERRQRREESLSVFDRTRSDGDNLPAVPDILETCVLCGAEEPPSRVALIEQGPICVGCEAERNVVATWRRHILKNAGTLAGLLAITALFAAFVMLQVETAPHRDPMPHYGVMCSAIGVVFSAYWLARPAPPYIETADPTELAERVRVARGVALVGLLVHSVAFAFTWVQSSH